MRRRRGLLLFSVLLIASILAMMVTAMLRVNVSSLGFLTRAESQSQALEGCMTAVDYARARLQGDASWGASAFGSATITINQPGMLRVTESGGTLAANRVQGTLAQGEVFEMRILNNLSGTIVLPPPTWARRSVVVPTGAALLVVDGGQGAFGKRHVECLLTRASLSRSSIQSGGDLSVTLASNGQALDFRAREGEQNVVRSRGKILFPEGSRLSFGTTAGAGMIYASGDVNAGGVPTIDAQTGLVNNISGGLSLSDAENKAAIEEQSNGTFFPGQSSRPARLSADQLKTPAGSSRALPAGKYVFRGSDRVDFFSNPSADPQADSPTQSYQGRVFPGGATVGTPGQEAALFSDYRLLPQGKVEVNGSLVIESGKEGKIAKLGMGFDPLGELLPINLNPGYLKVGGNLTVEGDVAGAGTIVTTNEGAVTITGRSEMSSLQDLGIAIHADGPIHLKPVHDLAVSQDDTFFANDFLMFGKARTGLSSSNADTIEHWPADPPNSGSSGLGNDDSALGGGVIRDATYDGDYRADVLALMPGWSEGKTPGGRTFTPDQMTAIEGFLNLSETGGAGVDPGMSLGRHLRLREYIKSIDGGEPDASFLDYTSRNSDNAIRRMVYNQFNAFAQEAKKRGYSSFSDFFSSPQNPYLEQDWRDFSIRGLLYSRQSLFVSGKRDLIVRGTIATENGHITVSGLRKGSFQSDHQQVENFLDFTKVPLQVSQFWIDG